ncbi:hypothetical protein [Roseovarius sp. D22-M7]|uniref:hypothetical protein n=1 Tax=Roseovarius sp. D22-M7 TaxID=3127116 RepID=UPI00300FA198
MNEWGLPRWCDPSAYGDTKRWTLARWHWEFTRRRDDYRAETLTYLTLQREVEAARKRMKENPAPDARCAWETLSAQADKLWNRHWRKWGYSAPLDPSVSEFPQDDLLRWPHGGVTSMRGSHVGRAPELRNTLTPAPEELAVTINLDRPIAEQIKLVERVAKREQKELHGRLVQKRRHPVKWLGYLRTLDAREALPNASWQEFTEALFDADLVERHKDPAGGYRAPPPQAGRDKWEAANALRFNF